MKDVMNRKLSQIFEIQVLFRKLSLSTLRYNVFRHAKKLRYIKPIS